MIRLFRYFVVLLILMPFIFSSRIVWGDEIAGGRTIQVAQPLQLQLQHSDKPADQDNQSQASSSTVLDPFVGDWTESFTFTGAPIGVNGAGHFSFVKRGDNVIEGYQTFLNMRAGFGSMVFSNPILFLRGTIDPSIPGGIRWVVFPLNGNQEKQPLPNDPKSCDLPNGWPVNLSISPDGHNIGFGYTFAELQPCYPNHRLGGEAAYFALSSPAHSISKSDNMMQGAGSAAAQTSILAQTSMTNPSGFYDPMLIHFDTLDGVTVDPAKGTITLFGHRSHHGTFQLIPYFDYLAASLESENPTFSLEWTSGSEPQVDQALSISEGALEDRMAMIWDSNHKLNSLGAWFFNAAGAKNVLAGQNAFLVFNAIFFSLGDSAKGFPLGFLGQMHSRYETQGQRYLNSSLFQNDLQGLLVSTIPMETRNDLTRRFRSGQITEQQLQVSGEIAMLQGFANIYGLDSNPILQAFNANLSRGADEALFAGFTALYADTKIIGKEAISRLIAGKILYAPPEIMSQLLGGIPRVHPIFTGMPPQSLLAQTAVYADVFCKNLMSMPEVKTDIPQYRTYFEWRRTLSATPATEGHLWITSNGFELNESPDGLSLRFGRTPMQFHIDKFHASHDEPEDPLLGQYANELTGLYDPMAEKFPVLQELRESMKVMAIAVWLKSRGYHIAMPAQGRGSWTPPAELPGVFHGAFAVEDPQRGQVGTILSAEGGIDYRVDKWWVFHKSPDRILFSNDDGNFEPSVQVSWNPQTGELSPPGASIEQSLEADGLKNCHDERGTFGTLRVICQEGAPAPEAQNQIKVIGPSSSRDAVYIGSGKTPQLLRKPEETSKNELPGKPQANANVLSCEQTLANLKKEATILEKGVEGLEKGMKPDREVREESEKMINDAVEEAKNELPDSLLGAFTKFTGDALDKRLENANEKTEEALLKRMQEHIGKSERLSYDAEFKTWSKNKKDIQGLIDQLHAFETGNDAAHIEEALTNHDSSAMDRFYDAGTKYLGNPLVQKVLKFSGDFTGTLEFVDALKGDLDSSYLLASEYLSWQNIKQLDKNTDQYLKAIKAFREKLEATMKRIKTVESEMRKNKLSACP